MMGLPASRSCAVALWDRFKGFLDCALPVGVPIAEVLFIPLGAVELRGAEHLVYSDRIAVEPERQVVAQCQIGLRLRRVARLLKLSVE